MPSTPRTYDDVRLAFDSGSILSASKEELELLLVANGQARILQEANQARASEMGETMRQLLAARQSQEMHGEALCVSKVALCVSVIALIIGLAGAVVASWPLLYPKPTEVFALQPLPVEPLNLTPPELQTEPTSKTKP